MKTLAREPRHDVAAQCLLAAEQMRAAGDVEQKAVGRIEADQRRVAVAPVGDRDRHASVGGRIGIGNGDARIHRARIGERHAGREPEPRAASLSAARRSAPFTGSATTSGSSACLSERPRISRSVESRRSHTER